MFDKETLKERLDAMKWSFSRINTFQECPKMFELTYLTTPKPKEAQNAFAQWGTLMHKILNENAIGKLPLDKMIKTYQRRFKTSITVDFPMGFKSDLRDTYYYAGIAYLFNYTGVPDSYEILESEAKLTTKLDNYDFIGYIDLLLREKATGNIILIDHKSKNGFKSKKERREYARQLYLYSKYVYERYGEYPTTLVFNLLRLQQQDEIPFDAKEYADAVKWAVDTIESIYSTYVFQDKLELNAQRKQLFESRTDPDYFCNNICSMRDNCPAF